MPAAARKPVDKPALKESQTTDIDEILASIRETAIEVPEVAVSKVFGVVRDAADTPRHRNFVLLVPENPTEDELKAAWNMGGALPPKDQAIEYYPR